MHLAAIVDAAQDAIISMSRDGIILSWNKSAERIYGYSSLEAVGKSIKLIVPDERKGEIEELLGNIRLDKRIEFYETICKRKDGQKIDLVLSFSPIRNNQGEIIGASTITHDISHLKDKWVQFEVKEFRDRTESLNRQRIAALNLMQDLQIMQKYQVELNERFKLAKESADIGIWDWDIKHNLLVWDDRMLELYGTTAASFDKKMETWKTFIHKEDLGLFEEFIRQALISNKKDNVVYRIVRPDKTVRYLRISAIVLRDSEGRPIRLIGTNWDITESKNLEISLRDQKWAIDQHSIVAITDVSGKITYANDKFCEISKYSREELLGQDHRILNSGYHSREFFRELWQTIARGKVWKGEVRNKAKDGSFYWVDATIVPFLNAEGKPYQYLAIRTDITKRKAAEEDLINAMNAKSDFTSMVSHELRTPLTVIKESVAIVEDGTAGQLNPDQKDFLETAKRNIDRLGRLINAVLDYQKLEAQRMEFLIEPHDINSIVKEIVTEFDLPVKNRGLKLETNLCAGVPLLPIDKDKIVQVLHNLMSNALKFTSAGTISVSTERLGDNAVKVSVRDSGVGIKEEDYEKLFKSFSQISHGNNRQTGGTGLGLVLCKKIIEHHKGQIGVSSEWGKGTTFYFILPIKDRRS